MDGGKYSRAYSKKSVRTSINGVIKTTQAQNPDVAFYQEIDPDGDRSQHVNEVKMVTGAQQQYANIYGQNYDSAYLFYPFTQPIGKAKSGILTLSKAKVDSSRRYSLPVDTDFNKIIDLDRAFTATKTTVANGKQFVMVNIHMSAFTPNVKIQQAPCRAKLRNLRPDGAGDAKLERRRRFEPKNPRSRSRLTTSATKPGRCVVCTAEPHLAYDCSALALRSLKD
jgi:endonuclease/exonuclease/phosphatase family metal-dependent hydrolase